MESDLALWILSGFWFLTAFFLVQLCSANCSVDAAGKQGAALWVLSLWPEYMFSLQPRLEAAWKLGLCRERLCLTRLILETWLLTIWCQDYLLSYRQC